MFLELLLAAVAPTLAVAKGAAAAVDKTQVVGWSATTYAVVAVGTLLSPITIAALRFIFVMKKQGDSADGSLRTDLMGEIEELRGAMREDRKNYDKVLAEERKDCERRLSAMQSKMDAITRQFVQFQLIIAGAIPPDKAPAAHQAAQRLVEIISQDLTTFEPTSDSELDMSKLGDRA